MANLRLTGTVKISVANDRVQLLLQTADDDDVELDLSSDDASRFGLDMLEAAAAANPENELAGSADGQGDEAISGVKVEVADYGIDQSLQNVFLTLREKGGAEFCFLVGKKGCIEFARDVLLRIFGQSIESEPKH
jgi:hypothetical protein